MSKFICFFYFLVITTICMNNMNAGAQSDIFQVCGARLSELVSVICGNFYSDPRLKKSPMLIDSNQPQFNAEALGDAECMQLKLVEQFNNANKRERNQRKLLAGDFELNNKVPSASFINRNDAFNMGKFIRQTRGGVVDECCRKACTLKEIKGYCGPER